MNRTDRKIKQVEKKMKPVEASIYNSLSELLQLPNRYIIIGRELERKEWQEKIETIIEKLKMLSNRYEYIDKQYVIRKTTLDVFIQELEDEK